MADSASEPNLASPRYSHTVGRASTCTVGRASGGGGGGGGGGRCASSSSSSSAQLGVAWASDQPPSYMRPTAGGSSRDTNGEGSARRATTVSHYGRMCNPRQGFAIPGEMRMAAERDVGAFEGGSTPRGLASSRLAPPRIPPPDEKRTKGGGGGGRGGGAASSSSHARAVPLGEASPADAMALPPTHVWGDAPPPRAANLPSLTQPTATPP